jgi:hypothetical protein
MPSLLKIGRSKYGGESRADIFYKNDTAVPTPFELEYESYSEDCIWDEAELHKKLADYRINGSREFFKCAVQVAIDVCNSQISKVKPTEGLVNAEIRIREVADGEFNQSERCDMGHRIGLLMLTSHMTATDIAKACGVTRRQLYNWKEGQVPREKRLVKLASVLGVSREYLLYGGDDE